MPKRVKVPGLGVVQVPDNADPARVVAMLRRATKASGMQAAHTPATKADTAVALEQAIQAATPDAGVNTAQQAPHQPMGPFNDPNSISSQIGDVGALTLRNLVGGAKPKNLNEAFPDQPPIYANVPASEPAVEGMTVFHGSPHVFDKFDLSKVGTGEGNAAYGHGLYFAEDAKIGGHYRDVLSESRGPQFHALSPEENILVPGWVRSRITSPHPNASGPGNPSRSQRREAEILRDEFLARQQQSFAKAADPNNHQPWLDRTNSVGQGKIAEALDKLLAADDYAFTKPGALYEVDIPDEHVANMLNWDTRVEEQPAVMDYLSPEALGLTFTKHPRWAYVDGKGRVIGEASYSSKEKLEDAYLHRKGDGTIAREGWQPTEIGAYYGYVNDEGRLVGPAHSKEADAEDIWRSTHSPLTGQELYNRLTADYGSQQKASEALRNAGIPGIRYLDHNSRSGESFKASYGDVSVQKPQPGGHENITPLEKVLLRYGRVRQQHGAGVTREAFLDELKSEVRWIVNEQMSASAVAWPTHHLDAQLKEAEAALRVAETMDFSKIRVENTGKRNIVLFDDKLIQSVRRK